MNRVIKFRVWSEIRKSYVYPVVDVTQDFNNYHNENRIFEQYTGLKDKNGVKCWEGDKRMYRGKEYNLISWGWCYVLDRNLVEHGESETIKLGEDEAYESELIGNLHTNPELLDQ